MKKIFLSIALLFVCAFGLVACGNKVSEELEAASKYLDGMYLSGEVVDGAFVAKAEETESHNFKYIFSYADMCDNNFENILESKLIKFLNDNSR